MHKWSANVVTADGRSFKGRVKILSETQVSVRGHDVLAPNTMCQIGIALPEQPGADVLRQVDILCSVIQVVFGANRIRPEMSVDSLLPEMREIFRANVQHGVRKT